MEVSKYGCVNSFEEQREFNGVADGGVQCGRPAGPQDEDWSWLRARRHWHMGHQRWVYSRCVWFFFFFVHAAGSQHALHDVPSPT